ncbi:MAG: SLOG family protein [Myxococcota bacterium]|jgi:predicted RNA methylase
MRTSAAALELDFTEPSIAAAKAVADTLARNGSLQRNTLLWVMEQAYGGSSADGRWSLRDAYDMLELAQVMHLAKADLPSAPNDCLAALTELVANLPTHTVRSEEQIELQQFSTPAPIAYLATLAARIAPTDLVLEPSAGTGLLAVFARRAGARLVLNEIDPARAEMLAAAFPGVAVTRHDAELIHDLLPPTIRPTAVLINPPFSRSVGRHADPLAALRHLRAALLRLGAGGRCAAILPDRITFATDDDMKTFADNLLATLNKVRAHVGDMYLVHGGDMKGIERLAASWADQNGIPQVRFGLDRKLGDRAGFRRNEQMLSLKPRFVIAFQGNGVTERLVIEAKARNIRVVDRRGPLGIAPASLNAGRQQHSS